MGIDVKLLDKCAVLTDYEKELVRRIDVKGEIQASVARFYKKTPSTICLQHKQALNKFLEWEKKQESPPEANLDKHVFERLNRGDSPWVIIADVGHGDEVIDLSEKWRELHKDDYWSAWNLLRSYGLASGFEEEEKPLTNAVEATVDWLNEAYDDLRERQREIRDLRQKLEDATKNSKALSSQLNAAQEEIVWLERFKKYEGLSDEMKQALQGEVDLLRSIVRDLKSKIEDLKIEKNSLEMNVGSFKRIETEVKTDIQNAVLQYMGSLQLSDVLRIYNVALRSRIPQAVVP